MRDVERSLQTKVEALQRENARLQAVENEFVTNFKELENLRSLQADNARATAAENSAQTAKLQQMQARVQALESDVSAAR